MSVTAYYVVHAPGTSVEVLDDEGGIVFVTTGAQNMVRFAFSTTDGTTDGDFTVTPIDAGPIQPLYTAFDGGQYVWWF